MDAPSIRTAHPRCVWRRSVVVLFATLAALAAPACTVTSREMTISVHDAVTGAPVAGAWVEVRPLYFYYPDADTPIVNPSARAGGAGRTSGDGSIQLAGTSDHPMQIIVLAESYPPVEIDVDEYPAGGYIWRGPSLPGVPDGPAFEVRLRP